MGCYLWVWMSANDDGHWTRITVTQDRIDFIECHAVHRRIIDFYNLITTPAKAPTRNHQKANDFGRSLPWEPGWTIDET